MERLKYWLGFFFKGKKKKAVKQGISMHTLDFLDIYKHNFFVSQMLLL